MEKDETKKNEHHNLKKENQDKDKNNIINKIVVIETPKK